MLEVGQILDGCVSGLTDFGAFVKLPGGETGMVHISEVADFFVKDIHSVLSEGQSVKVKVLEIGEKGKVSLSVRQAGQIDKDIPEKPVKSKKNRPAPKAAQSSPEQKSGNMTFEDMLASFKKTSEDRMSDLKRSTESKRGSRRGYGRN